MNKEKWYNQKWFQRLELAAIWGIALLMLGLHWYDSDWGAVIRFILPAGDAKSMAGTSYISVATGLNMALVKFELFRKTLQDVQKSIDDRHTEVKQTKVAPLIGVDEESMLAYDAEVAEELAVMAKKCYSCQMEFGRRFRLWAIQFMIMGVAALLFQWSVGLYGILFLLPAIAVWLVKRRANKDFDHEAESFTKIASRLAKRLNDRRSQTQRAETVQSQIEKAKDS